MKEATVSAEFPYSSQYIEILGSKMHYIEQGKGGPILFLHGMPTSCYVWRNIIPHLKSLGRCIAVDLIGMGKSDKPDIDYTIEDHIRYIDQFIATLKLKNVIIVMHGWGSLIGFHYAMHHEDNCKGLVFYEAFLHPLKGDYVSLPYQEQLIEESQEESNQEDLFRKGTYFIDKLLPQSIMRELTVEEVKHYREPFLQEGAGKVLEQYWHELPRGDGKSKVDQLIARYSQMLKQSSLPKLLLYSIPGFITTIATIMWAKENLLYLEVGEVGEELHFAQEARPQLMGELISAWLQAVEQQVKIK